MSQAELSIKKTYRVECKFLSYFLEYLLTLEVYSARPYLCIVRINYLWNDPPTKFIFYFKVNTDSEFNQTGRGNELGTLWTTSRLWRPRHKNLNYQINAMTKSSNVLQIHLISGLNRLAESVTWPHRWVFIRWQRSSSAHQIHLTRQYLCSVERKLSQIFQT